LVTSEPCISGTVLLDQRRVIDELLGPGVLDRAIGRLAPEMQDEYRALTPLSWCRATTATALIHALADESERNARKLQAEIVRRGIEHTLKTVWRVLMRLTTDEALIRRTTLIYSKSINTGEIRVHAAERGVVHIYQTGWAEMTELDFIGLATGIETVLRLAGRDEVHVKWDGTPPRMHYVATWRS
jgi:hypothetical protein